MRVGGATGPTPTPRQLVSEARRRLAAAAEPALAARARGYFKPGERVAFFGLTAPALRRLEKELYARVRSGWTEREAIAFCDALLWFPQLEAKALGVLLLVRYHRSSTRALMRTCRSWLARGLLANWATTDTLSALVIAPLLRRFPDETASLERWTCSRSLWVRRAAAVSLTPLARRGEALDSAYRVAAALLDDANDLIHKASGWLLREAGKTDAARLERFLLGHGPRLPRTTLRYAIERLPASRRRSLLQATRG